MLESIRNLFNMGKKADYTHLVKNGAIILDVRTQGEFQCGHIKGAINIPVDQLDNNLKKLADKNKPIITCCASGIRSASAKTFLLSKGYSEVFNGGGWNNLQQKLEK